MSLASMASVDYLVGHVASGDGRGQRQDSGQGSALTRYYTADGYPPGRWVGSGLAGLAGGRGIPVGAEVTESELRALFEDGVDPVTGELLIRRSSARFPIRAERIDRRVARLYAEHPEMPADVRAEQIEKIRVEERKAKGRHAVAGFDLTFKPPKSVSALWAIADHGVQVQLYDAHCAALNQVLARVEAEALFTRTGAQGRSRDRTRGLVAAAFDHWDSRAGDPLLHTHVTVANKVQGTDGGWRTVDSRSLYRSTVAFSELYQVLLADEVTRRLGLGWERRGRGRKGRPGRELAVVPEALAGEFSGRSALIEPEVDAAVDRYRDAHGGRAPSQRMLWRIRQAVTLDTRTGKHTESLQDATSGWRIRAARVLGADPTAWATAVTRAAADRTRPLLLRQGDLTVVDCERLAVRVVDQVSGNRSTWTTWNLAAEAMRQIGQVGWQFADPDAALDVRRQVVDRAVALSVLISPPQVASVPDRFLDPATGVSRFADPPLYTSQAVLAAEDRLLARSRDTAGPGVDPDLAVRTAQAPLPGRDHPLDPEDQAPAAVTVTTSGRVLDVLVGPAGTGKTTTMAGVRAVWEAEHGPGSVRGLAPSAQAARVRADDLGVPTENTAQWLAQQVLQPSRADRITALIAVRARAEAANRPTAGLDRAIAAARHEYDLWALRPGQLLVIDEAGMAGTFALDRLARQAADAGAKLLLVGDPHQLSAVETGGAFGMLIADRPLVAELTVIRRFTDPDGRRRRWEEDASIGIRLGRVDVLDTYRDHDRIRTGGRDDMVAAAYAGWRADTAAGLTPLLIAGDTATVQDLNQRARTDLVAAGLVDPAGVTLHDGLLAGRGDRIVTREINRYLEDGTGYEPAGRSGRRRDGFVRNGQQWIVEHARVDGSLTVRFTGPDHRPGAASVTLPAWYVRDHVELAYAVTAHRAQGMTVDTCHTIADPATTREVFYVAMTRGKRRNTAYAALDTAPDEHGHGPTDDETWTDRDLLAHILANSTAERSAHQSIADELDKAESLASLVGEYETIAAYGHDLAAVDLVYAAGWPDAQTLTEGEGFRSVAAALRAAHTRELNTEHLTRHLASIAARDHGTDTATSAARAAEAIRAWTAAQTTGRRRPARRLIGGIVPDASHGITNNQVLTALRERATPV